MIDKKAERPLLVALPYWQFLNQSSLSSFVANAERVTGICSSSLRKSIRRNWKFGLRDQFEQMTRAGGDGDRPLLSS